jgi:hypothetical protein
VKVRARHLLGLNNSSVYDIYTSVSFDHGNILANILVPMALLDDEIDEVVRIARGVYVRTGRATVAFWVDRSEEFKAKSLQEFSEKLHAWHTEWLRGPYSQEGKAP